MGDGVKGSPCPVPAVVAVHCKIAADQGAKPNTLRQTVQKSGDSGFGTCRQDIAAVGKAMQCDRTASLCKTGHYGKHMVTMGMNPAGRQQPHHMNACAPRCRLCGQCPQRCMAGKASILTGHIDTGQILHHNPPGADIHVAYFGIANLSFWQADIRAGCCQQTGRPLRRKRVDRRR